MYPQTDEGNEREHNVVTKKGLLNFVRKTLHLLEIINFL